jgi:ABC-type antimicrobial peptide transport system permease subunit
MSFFDLVKTSASNLYQRKARTLLTILGVVIGTMSIVLMIALGEGSKQVFMEQVSQSNDLTKIEVYGGYSSSGKGVMTLDDETVTTREGMENVRSVLPITDVPLYLKSPRYVAELYVSAAPIDKLSELAEKLEWGTIVKTNDISLIIGKGFEQNFRVRQGNKDIWELAQAENIDFASEKFDVYFGGSYIYTSEGSLPEDVIAPKPSKGKVTGVFRETGSELDYQGYIDIAFVQKLIKSNKKFCEAVGISDNYQRLFVYTNDMNNVEGVLTQIKDLGFEAYSPMEYIKQMQQESERQQAQWGAVGAIALIVSAIGIINTMLTSIMERKREIGVLKVLGCSLPKINAMFLLEAAMIGMLGGVVGVGLSYGVSALVHLAPSDGGSILGGFFSGDLRFVITPYVAVAAVIGAALIGMLAGIYPALRAMHMSPLSALRDE